MQGADQNTTAFGHTVAELEGTDLRIGIVQARFNAALTDRLAQSCLDELMLLGAIAGAEMAMRDTGIGVELGSGVAAAQAEFRDGMQAKIKQVAAE